MASRELIAGRYRLEAQLGRGGSAIVERAIDTRLQRPVALKRMRGAEWDERLRRRFLDEAKTLASVRHPNLLEVYDAGIDERGTPYVASRLLDGETLEQRVTDGPVDPDVALRWCLPILGALAVAHDHEIVHRDVKPSNIFLERLPDGRRCPVLLDFGIARRAAHAGDTTPGTALGTPAYIAPEVIAGEPPSPASDLWSMGVVLYRLLSGRHPFDVSGSLAAVAAIVRDAPAPLGERAPAVPTVLALVVDRALRPAHQRYPDARAFARALVEAAVASELELPAAPDPHGLPDWGRWVAESTSRDTTARVQTEPSRPAPIRRPALLIAALSVLVVAFGLGALWDSDDGVGASTQAIERAGRAANPADTAESESRDIRAFGADPEQAAASGRATHARRRTEPPSRLISASTERSRTRERTDASDRRAHPASDPRPATADGRREPERSPESRATPDSSASRQPPAGAHATPRPPLRDERAPRTEPPLPEIVTSWEL